MPTYRYRCSTCGDELEVWQSMADARLTVHEGDCGGPLTRVMSAASIVLKGSGFYKTDNRGSSGSRRDSKSDSKPDSTSESKSESKSDSKSESKSESKSDSKSDSKNGSKSTSESGSSKAATPA